VRTLSNQVTACWQWRRFLYGNLRHGKAPILLNLDETSIHFFMEPHNRLCVDRKMMHASDLRCGRNVSKGQQRSAMTYIGLICADDNIQKDLPQILLVAKKAMPECRRIPALMQGVSPVQLWIRKSAWINRPVFIQVLKQISEVLQKHDRDTDISSCLWMHTLCISAMKF
jgi:hypothetical protein